MYCLSPAGRIACKDGSLCDAFPGSWTLRSTCYTLREIARSFFTPPILYGCDPSTGDNEAGSVRVATAFYGYSSSKSGSKPSSVDKIEGARWAENGTSARALLAQYAQIVPRLSLRWPGQSGCGQGTSSRMVQIAHFFAMHSSSEWTEDDSGVWLMDEHGRGEGTGDSLGIGQKPGAFLPAGLVPVQAIPKRARQRSGACHIGHSGGRRRRFRMASHPPIVQQYCA
jgi:hypothetical protein